jgi:predicted O-linked N-acetylglucosamine transferase (SPINDLY family)
VPEPDAAALDQQFQHALEHYQQGRVADAERVLLEVSRWQPDRADVWHLLGIMAQSDGRLDEAVALIGKAIELDDTIAAAHNNRAVLLRRLGRPEEALASFDRAIALEPDYGEAHNNRGYALLECGRLEEANASFDTAIALRPDYAAAHNNRGILFRRMGRFEDALAEFDTAIASRPDDADAHANRGAVLLDLDRAEEALAACDRAIALRPGNAGSYRDRGNALLLLERYDKALASHDQAIALRPDYAEAYGDRGNALRFLERTEEALASYAHAIELKPDDAGPCYSRGELLRAEGRTDEAIATLDAGAAADRLHGACRLAACMARLPILYRTEAEIAARRRDYLAALDHLVTSAEDPAVMRSIASEIGAPPFHLPYQCENDVVPQATYGRLVTRILADTWPAAPLAPLPPAGGRIRLGIVSGFFCFHTIFKLFLEGWLTELDRDRFEVIGFHTSRLKDARTAQSARLCDRFVQDLPSRAAWRAAITDAAPHVLIYPELGMDPIAGWLAAQRLAPVQCAAWGHPETTGLPTIDYFLSSELMEPPDGAAHYTEPLILMPGLGTHFTPDKDPPEAVDHAGFGLDPAIPTFWSGQSLFKYLPQYDCLFPRIAREVGECRFVFVTTLSPALTAIFTERLGQAFAAEGLDASRHCVMLRTMPHKVFFNAVGLADVILDPPGWSGGKTTLDYLAHDPAIVTWPGRFMRGRHTAAILRQIGCEATIAGSAEEYVAMAVRLGTDPASRTQVREGVAEGKQRAFRDTEYIRALETFLIEAVARA